MAIDTPHPVKIRRTHLALFVTDPYASASWYQEVLGMEITARDKEAVFLSFGKKHHDIALMKADFTGNHVGRGSINMQHYGLEIAGGIEELRRLYGMLLRKKVPVVKVRDHKVGYGVYFSDPDGHRFEFFCELIADDEEGKQVLNIYNGPSDPLTLDPL
ncbi:MAG: VOC family protein [Steroidobacteraceae bacterium]